MSKACCAAPAWLPPSTVAAPGATRRHKKTSTRRCPAQAEVRSKRQPTFPRTAATARLWQRKVERLQGGFNRPVQQVAELRNRGIGVPERGGRQIGARGFGKITGIRGQPAKPLHVAQLTNLARPFGR